MIPAKRSSTLAPMTRSPKAEKMASLTISIVGRASWEAIFNGMLPADPEMTLIELNVPTARRSALTPTVRARDAFPSDHSEGVF